MVSFFSIVSIVLIGAVLGSFTTALIYRVKNKKSWSLSNNRVERSHCIHCQTQLSKKDLVTVLSWFLLKGKCRHCRKNISKQYMLIELATIFICLFLYFILPNFFSLVVTLTILPFLLSQIILLFQNKFISYQLCSIIGLILVISLLVKLYIIN